MYAMLVFDTEDVYYTWSMKPAWTHPPQSSVADGEKCGPRLYLGPNGEA